MINPNEVFLGPDGVPVTEARPGASSPVEVVLKDLIKTALLFSGPNDPAGVKLRRFNLLTGKILKAKKELKLTSKDITLILEAGAGVLSTWAYGWVVSKIDPNQLRDKEEAEES